MSKEVTREEMLEDLRTFWVCFRNFCRIEPELQIKDSEWESFKAICALIEHGPVVDEEFVEKWMDTWDDDCGSFGPSLQQVISLLTEAGVTVKEGK